MVDPAPKGLAILVRGACWLLILGVAGLALIATAVPAEAGPTRERSFEEEAHWRLLLGAKELAAAGNGHQDLPTPSFTPKPGSAGIRQAIVAKEWLAAAEAIDLLPRGPGTEASAAWLEARWRGEEAGEPPPEFPGLAGPFAALLDPDRREAYLERLRWLSLLASLGVILGLTGGVAGLVLATLGALAWIRHRDSVLAQAGPTHEAALLGVFTLYLIAFIAYGQVLPDLPFVQRVGATWGFIAVLPALLIVARSWTGWSWADLRASTGLHRGRGILREIGAGLVGYLAGLPVILAGITLTNLLAQVFPVTHPLAESVMEGGADGAKALILASMACIFAPVVEEFTFRGLLFTHLRGRVGLAVAAIGSAAIFAAIHPQGLAGIPALMAIAMVFAGIRAWRGSLIAPIAAHALHNGILVAMLLLLFSG